MPFAITRSKGVPDQGMAGYDDYGEPFDTTAGGPVPGAFNVGSVAGQPIAFTPLAAAGWFLAGWLGYMLIND